MRVSSGKLGTKRKQASPLVTFPLIGPGFRGLNTELSTTIGLVDPLWALVLDNAVFDDSGRVATRRGHVNQTTSATGATDTLNILHEYTRDDGTSSLITLADDFTFFESTDDGATWTDITGAVVTTNVRWKFVNFEDDLWAVAPGHKVHQYNTALGVFTEVADSPVTNGTITASFGRLWVGVDAIDRIDYSGLLFGTDWTSASTGSVDLSNVWTQGNDQITAIAGFGATLVVFGKKHIILYVDGTGSQLGIDPNNMYVVDTIEGTGCLHRDSVINIGEGDLWYQSKQGIQSLARVVSDKTNPLADITRHVRSLVQDLSDNEVGSETGPRAIYSEKHQMAIYLYPESDTILILDTKVRLEDGTFRAARWLDMTFNAITVRNNDDILFGRRDGSISRYEGYRDDSTGVYDLVYATPWLDLGEEAHNRLKIIKQFYGIFYGRETLQATANWAVDFRPFEFQEIFQNDFQTAGAQFGVGQYNQDEFATGFRLRRQYVAGAGEGQFLQFQVAIQSLDVDALVSIQEIGLMTKLGRGI